MLRAGPASAQPSAVTVPSDEVGEEALEGVSPQRNPWLLVLRGAEVVLSLAAVAWLVLVGWTYGRLALHPFTPTRAEVPGLADGEGWILPLLLSFALAAILRYFRRRIERPRPVPAGATVSGGDQDTL